MLLILAIAIFNSDTISLYKVLIICGLIFSLVGDVMLMRPINKFAFGLIAFFITHLFYVYAFGSVEGFQDLQVGWVILFVGGFVLFYHLSRSLHRLKIPVFFYITVISLMTWQAGELWMSVGTSKATFAFVGAILFCISDSILSISRFKVNFKLSQAIILGTYYPAQLFIALSV